MADELKLDSLSDMKLADYIAAFKKKAQWKKAKNVIVLKDFKFGTQKATVVLPFKKETDAKAAFKRIKDEKLHKLQKTGLGNFVVDKVDGSPLANIEFTKGGLKAEQIAKKAEKLFSKIKLALDFGLGSDNQFNEEAVTEASQSTDTTEQEDSQQSDVTALVEQLKGGFTGLKDQFSQFKANVVPKVKEESVVQQDLDFIQELLGNIQSYGQKVQQAPAQLKSQFEQALAKLEAQAPTLQKILDKFADTGAEAESLVQKSQKRLKEIKARIAEIKAELSA